ncbi:MAG: hypothetical protein ACYDA4_04665 [Ignavibacteriaceae bacterium]
MNNFSALMKSFAFSYIDIAPVNKLLIYPIMISNEQIKKFQVLYKKHFGEELSTEEAYQSGAKLIGLIELTYKLKTKEEFRMVERRRVEIYKKLLNENEVQSYR